VVEWSAFRLCIWQFLAFSLGLKTSRPDWIVSSYVYRTSDSWLRHCATSRMVAGSIPDVVGIFHGHNRSGRTMAMGSTQPLTEMSTRNISWGVKVASD
jgi:hypothetical protein